MKISCIYCGKPEDECYDCEDEWNATIYQQSYETMIEAKEENYEEQLQIEDKLDEKTTKR